MGWDGWNSGLRPPISTYHPVSFIRASPFLPPDHDVAASRQRTGI